jgi:hypothetical protein
VQSEELLEEVQVGEGAQDPSVDDALSSRGFCQSELAGGSLPARETFPTRKKGEDLFVRAVAALC